MKKIGLALVACLLCQSALATSITWLELRTSFSYRDLKQSCNNSALGNKLYFAAEIDESGAILEAVLKRHNDIYSGKPYAFSEEERKAIVLYKDRYGTYWLKNLPLLEKAVVWVLNNMGDSFCSPTKPVTTAGPAPAGFFFDTESLGEELMLSVSNEVSLKGTLNDKTSYEAEITLTESLVN